MSDAAMFKRTITYGDYEFDWTTMSVSSQNQLSGDGGRTLTHTRTTFNIAGFLSASTEANMKVLLDSMKNSLSKPRQRFIVNHNGSVFYDIKHSTANDNQDIKFGPTCTNFTVENFLGGVACAYSAEIVVNQKLCPSSSREDVLLITKETTYNVDRDGYTKRIISGQLVTTSQAFTPDRFKEKINVAVPQNFKRISQVYKVLNDGVTMNYSFVDVEEKFTRPKTVTSGDVDFSQSTTIGALINLTLQGYFVVDGSQSKDIAIREIFNLLRHYFLPLQKDSFIFTKQEIKTNIYGPRIDFLFTGTVAGENLFDVTKKTNVFASMTDKPPGSEKGKSRKIPLMGSSGLQSNVRDLEDACLNVAINKPDTDKKEPQDKASSKVTKKPTRKALSTDLSKEHKENPYMDFVETLGIMINSNKVVYVPKKKGEKQIVQQKTVETVNVIQQGYASRYDKSPQVPAPKYSTIMQRDVTPEVAILDNGLRLYSVSWRYVIRIHNNNFKLAGLTYPNDPRRSKEDKTQVDFESLSEFEVNFGTEPDKKSK
ncbi:MAG: hypothetical protein KOO65_08525 [Desulfobacterales bacterium]|nr:hypothetical protein [Desulfobacterales bacterium]